MTPGPWQVKNFSIEQGGYTVAMVWPDKRVSPDESLARMNANAQAIAALPAMVEALKKAAAKLGVISATGYAGHGKRYGDHAREALLPVLDALELAGIEP